MTITRNWISAYVTGTSATLTPVAGGAFSPGDAIISISGVFAGSATISVPPGNTQLDLNSGVHQVRCCGFISQNGAEPMPSFTWGAGSVAWALSLCYSGVNTSLAAGHAPQERASNQVQNIFYTSGSILPNMDGCLALYIGQRNKTATSNGMTYAAASGFSAITQKVNPGTFASSVICELIQTTATLIAANLSSTGTGTPDAAAQNMQSLAIILQPAVSPPGCQLL